MEISLEEKLRRIAGWIGATVFLLGLIVLLGGLAQRDLLHALRVEPSPMSANTAAGLLLLGASLWLQARMGLRSAGQVCAAVVLGYAIVKIGEAVSGADFRLDRWLQTSSSPLAANQLGRLSHSAVALGMSAVALLCLGQQRERRRFPLSAIFANLVIFVGATALLGLVLRSPLTIERIVRLDTHVALALLLIGVGVLLVRSNKKTVGTLFAENPTGILARRFFLAAVIAPLAVSALLMLLLRQQILATTDGVALFVAGTIVCGVWIAMWSIEVTTVIGERRDEAETARRLLTARLQEQATELQETVNLRTRELREANASLRATAESNALLALVAQHTTNSVVITDAQGRIEWTNAAFERLSGYTLAEVKGRKPGHFLQGPNSDQAAIARIRDAERNGQACQVDVLNYSKDGRSFWFAMDIQPVRDRENRLVNFVANQADITELRLAQARLQHLNQRFQLATRAVAIGVWEWDAATDRSTWDERTFDIYGLHPDQFTGTRDSWLNRLHPDDRERVLAEALTALASDDSYEHSFRIVRASDGVERHVLSRAIVVRDPQGRPLRVIGADRDVSLERETTQRTEALNERLRLALRSSNYGVWEIDLATGRRDWDARMLEIYGLKAEDFSGTAGEAQSMIHPEDRSVVAAQMQQALAGKVARYDGTFRIIRPDGEERYIEAHGYLDRDASGRASRMVGLVRDITAQKQLEQALVLAEQRWQLALEGTNDSVWDWEIATGEIYQDDRWSLMLGYERDEAPRTNAAFKALIHPDDLADNETALQDHFEQRTALYQHELRMRAKDGSWRWILDRGKVVRRAADGRPLRMAGTHTDITARKQLEERLRKTEELANAVSRLAQIGGWEIDLEASRVTWNEGTRRIHDVDETFVPTLEEIWKFFPADALATVQNAIADATPAAPSFDVEVPLITARGRRIWVRLLAHGEFLHGRPVSMHGAIQDVTAQHESEASRRGLEAQLFQAQKMETLGTLAGGIAHDFNNLLTGIIGYHELAADSVPEDHPARMCLNEARNASLRARELVEQILTFGRQSGGIEHAAIDLSVVVDEARRFLRATLPANITIELSFAPDCPSVLADATQIHQLILNLGSNAGHAMRQHGGALKISLEPTEVTPDLALTIGGPPANSYVRLSVSDTGHGMDEATRRRIFDPFFTTKNTREGTGLGLAVVHGIVRAHRGAIDVESSPGKGSRFHIYLPTAEEDTADEESVSTGSPRGAGEFIYVVDDEEVVGSCTKMVLENKGYRSLIFSSAEQCLAELQANPQSCAVLVTDQTMPGMQGTELAAKLRRLNPTLPVVIMSGYFSKISPQALDELGQIELLAKPFTTDELAVAVHRALHPTGKSS